MSIDTPAEEPGVGADCLVRARSLTPLPQEAAHRIDAAPWMLIALAKGKTQAWSSDALRDNHVVQHLIDHSDAALKAAKAGVMQAFDACWASVTNTLEGRVAVRQTTTYAIHIARVVVHYVYHVAGSTAFFDDQPFERRLRDVNSPSRQLPGRRTNLETAGVYLWGGEVNTRWL